ncbi:male-specific histamine-binding salivary protein-like [Rhipicephalus sanguineus]|uniref:male-specific histamine-binding salivary protein-like n=1 Tax=Rhipicephalus sanguineus TaxID=34632 RepID=UPI0018955977|nr:male-specific histamine-binding salivary protein-like [Rhipicephalus sanguineus]
MKSLALFLVLGAAFCDQTQGTQKPDWADETKFGSYQDAWKSISQDQSKRYYLAKATTQNDSVWGDGFTCVSVTGVKIQSEDNKINATILYKNTKEPQLQTSHETVSTMKLYNYSNKDNGIKYETQGAEKQTFSDAFVFSDYKDCDVIFVPESEGSKTGDYELWVSEDKIEDIPSCCKFLIAYLASLQGKTVRDVYTNSSCKPSAAQK